MPPSVPGKTTPPDRSASRSVLHLQQPERCVDEQLDAVFQGVLVDIEARAKQGESGQQEVQFDLTEELYDFRTPVSAGAPPDDQTSDSSELTPPAEGEEREKLLNRRR
jgi:hypothetical protein